MKIMVDIKVKNWAIKSEGDSSVGIPDGEWVIKGEMFFENKEDLEFFRDKIREAFTSCVDESTIGVYTESEINEQVDKENKMWVAADYADAERQGRIPNY